MPTRGAAWKIRRRRRVDAAATTGIVDWADFRFCPGKTYKYDDVSYGPYSYAVQNITGVEMPDKTYWKETQDHSKWAVSTEKASTACVGDINRQWSQNKRGGGTVCLKDRDHWASFDMIVKNVLMCPS